MRVLFLIMACCLSIAVSAQEQKTTQHIGWKGGSIELHTIGNGEQACTLVASTDSVKAFWLNGNVAATELFTVQRYPDENFLGGFIKNGNVYLFLETDRKDVLHSWLYNAVTQQTEEHMFPFETKNEKIIDHISGPGYYVYLTVNKKTSEFITYKFTDESNYVRFAYPATEGVWEEITAKAGPLNSAKLDVKEADMAGECDIDIAKSSGKIYIHNDTALLVLNNKIGVSTVYTFDLSGNTMTRREISHHYVAEGPNGVSNSFLSGNKLYYAFADEESLFLQVVDFYSGSVLKEFSTTSPGNIQYKNTAITQEGSRFMPNGTRELSTTKQLLRKMTDGKIVITALPDESNHMVLTVGSYKEIVNNSGGGGMWMTGAARAPMVFVPTAGFSRSSWTKSARFQMLIDGSSCEHVDGDIGLSINDRIEEYTKEIKIPAEGENLFVLHKKYCYSYYNRADRSLSIVQF